MDVPILEVANDLARRQPNSSAYPCLTSGDQGVALALLARIEAAEQRWKDHENRLRPLERKMRLIDPEAR
jgi:hypothetical protein